MKAFIFAAGLGTRLAPLTNKKPKALVEINGYPMLNLLINRLKKIGVDYLVINIHHFGEQIIEFLNQNDFGIEIKISDERNLLLDTGGGLLNVKKYFSPGEDFIVHNVDIYSEINLNNLFVFHQQNNNICTLAVSHRKSTNYLLFDNNQTLCGWKSYKTGKEIISRKFEYYDEQAFSGIYVFNYEIFNLINNPNLSFPIIPELLKISKNTDIKAFNHDYIFMIDLGKPESIKELEFYLRTNNSF